MKNTYSLKKKRMKTEANPVIDISQKTYLSEAEACAFTSLSRDTLKNARDDHKLSYYVMGKRLFYKKEDLEQYIEENSQIFRSVKSRVRKNYK